MENTNKYVYAVLFLVKKLPYAQSYLPTIPEEKKTLKRNTLRNTLSRSLSRSLIKSLSKIPNTSVNKLQASNTVLSNAELENRDTINVNQITIDKDEYDSQDTLFESQVSQGSQVFADKVSEEDFILTNTPPYDLTQLPLDNAQLPLDDTQLPLNNAQLPLDNAQLPLDNAQSVIQSAYGIQEKLDSACSAICTATNDEIAGVKHHEFLMQYASAHPGMHSVLTMCEINITDATVNFESLMKEELLYVMSIGLICTQNDDLDVMYSTLTVDTKDHSYVTHKQDRIGLSKLFELYYGSSSNKHMLPIYPTLLKSKFEVETASSFGSQEEDMSPPYTEVVETASSFGSQKEDILPPYTEV